MQIDALVFDRIPLGCQNLVASPSRHTRCSIDTDDYIHHRYGDDYKKNNPAKNRGVQWARA